MNPAKGWGWGLVLLLLGTGPAGADALDTSERLYAANLDRAGVYILAPERLYILRTLASAHAACLCVDALRLYLVAPAFITIVDQTSLRTAGQVPLEARIAAGRCEALLAPDGAHLYLGSAETGPGMLCGVAEIDLVRKRTKRVLAPGRPTAGSIGLSSDGRALYVPCGARVLVLALPSGDPRRELDLAPAGSVERVLGLGNEDIFAATALRIPDPAGSTAAARAYRLQRVTLTSGRTAAADLPSHPLALALSPDGQWLYALCEGWLLRFTPSLTDPLVRSVSARALAVSPDARYLYLAEPGENRLSVWDARSFEETRTTHLGNGLGVLATGGPKWSGLGEEANR